MVQLQLKNKEWCSEELGLKPDDFEEITAQRRFQDVFEEYRRKAARQAATAAAVADAVAAADNAAGEETFEADNVAEEPEDLGTAGGLVDVIEDEEQFEMIFSD